MRQINKNDKNGLLKISQVAAAADASVTTVKYYVKEGLIDIACKTGKNMAYYSPEAVDRVRLIKSLQSERYYPLSVIKRLLQSGSSDENEAELLYTISKGDKNDYYEALPLRQAAQEAGLKPRQVKALADAGLITTQGSGRTRLCSRGDQRVMQLIKLRLDAGIPLEQSIRSFSMYQEHLKETARLDIRSLVADGMLTKSLSTGDIVRMINVSDETLDSFISMRRYALNAAVGAEYLALADEMLKNMELFAVELAALPLPAAFAPQQEKLRLALSGKPSGDEIMDEYCRLLHPSGSGTASLLSALHNGCAKFEKPPVPTGNSSLDMLRLALRLGFGIFALPELGFDPAALAAELRLLPNDDFVSAVSQLLNPR